MGKTKDMQTGRWGEKFVGKREFQCILWCIKFPRDNSHYY